MQIPYVVYESKGTIRNSGKGELPLVLSLDEEHLKALNEFSEHYLSCEEVLTGGRRRKISDKRPLELAPGVEKEFQIAIGMHRSWYGKLSEEEKGKLARVCAGAKVVAVEAADTDDSTRN